MRERSETRPMEAMQHVATSTLSQPYAFYVVLFALALLSYVGVTGSVIRLFDGFTDHVCVYVRVCVCDCVSV